jgi:hypothetical protein
MTANALLFTPNPEGLCAVINRAYSGVGNLFLSLFPIF